MEPVKEGKIKVLIADDHPVVLEGLALMLKSAPEITVTGFARNGDELLAKAKKLLPDVVILDVIMPGSNALDNIKALSALKPGPGILCCSSVTDRDEIIGLVNGGISGYIMKSTSQAELQQAIMKIANGGHYFTEEITGTIIDSIRTVHNIDSTAKNTALFTDKELEIIKLICREKTSKEISNTLAINVRTLESAKIRIMKKMEVKNIAGLVYYTLKNNLFDIDELSK